VSGDRSGVELRRLCYRLLPAKLNAHLKGGSGPAALQNAPRKPVQYAMPKVIVFDWCCQCPVSRLLPANILNHTHKRCS
jgi:hypothetical protein